MAGSPLSSAPLMESIVWCTFNTGPMQRAPEMKVWTTYIGERQIT